MATLVTRFTQLKVLWGSCSQVQTTRIFHASIPCSGKRNFRKFPTFNKRGTRIHKQQQATNPHPDVPVYTYGSRPTGYAVDGKYTEVPEMIPELVVPNLEGFRLKPYVSYRTPDRKQDAFSAEDLFGAVYAPKIMEDLKNGMLNAEGDPLKPSCHESLDAKTATAKFAKLSVDVI